MRKLEMTSESEVVLPVLRVLGEEPMGLLPTGEVRRRVKATLALTDDDYQPLRNRPDFRIDQTIRNLKSHKGIPGNPFFEGFLRDVPRGYAITERGLSELARRGLR
jgi:hypothetical protein